MKKASMLLASLLVSVLIFGAVLDKLGFNAAFGPLFQPSPNVPPLVGPQHGLDPSAAGTDRDQCQRPRPTPVAPARTRFRRTTRPGRSSRAMAIVHIAMFDTVNAVVGGYRAIPASRRARPALHAAAISQAAHDTLAALFPSQAATFDAPGRRFAAN